MTLEAKLEKGTNERGSKGGKAVGRFVGLFSRAIVELALHYYSRHYSTVEL